MRRHNFLFLCTGNSARSILYRMLRNRITAFAELPLASLDGPALERHMDEIGQYADTITEAAAR